ncbi:MAG: hypothetical protein NDI61_10075 [Bdellovibrionaceae bacterium]|nr:hypothetical protein [Pseudobdellovibrionaceae bacterium]
MGLLQIFSKSERRRTPKRGSTPSTQPFWIVLSLWIGLIGAMAGCGQGFQAQNQCPGGACQANDPGPTDPSDPAGSGDGSDTWKNLEVDGAISGGRYAQTPVLSLDKNKKLLKLRLPMIPSPYLILTREIPVAEIEGAKISWESLPDGSVAMVLSLPLDKYLKGLTFARRDKLPNGEDLPGIAGGELPSIAVRLVPGKDIKATIYLGPSTLAVFVNTPFDPVIRTPAIPIRDRTTSRTLGYFAIIPAVGDFEGGFYVSASLPDEIARVIDDAI